MSDKTFLLIKNMNHLKELYLKAKIKTALRRRFGKRIQPWLEGVFKKEGLI